MNHMIDELFFRFDRTNLSPEEKTAMNAAEPVFARVGEKLSWAEFDELYAAILSIAAADAQACFARGFRLGAGLMLEVLEGGEPAAQG